MKTIVTVILAVLNFFYASPVAAAPVAVIFSETAIVTGEEIILGDIAKVEGSDAELCARLRALKLGNAAAPAGKVTLTPEIIGYRLADSGLNLTSVAWSIPPQVVVSTDYQILDASGLMQQLIDEIYRRLQAGSQGAKYEVSLLNTPREQFIPVGKVVYEFEFPNGIRIGVPTNANVAVNVNDALYQRLTLRANVAESREVLVATRRLAANEVIGAADFTLRLIDVSKLKPDYYVEAQEVIGKAAKRTINNGEVLTKRLLDNPLAVERQAMVEIIVKIGNVHVSMMGQALESGREGELIRVRNTVSNKVITARVVDSTTVEVITQNGR